MPANDRAYPSVWARPHRKERSTLTREQIVRQALELLDSEGIEALSMRKLAAKLESGTTSLYWHVANRDELVELVVDEICGELEVPDHDKQGDWHDDAARFAHSMRDAVVRHPWVVSVLDHLVAGVPGPNLAAASERMLGVFTAAGFEIHEADQALNTLSAYVTGIAMAEAAWRNWMARHGQSAEEWAAEALQLAQDSAEDHPQISAAVDAYRGKDVLKAQDDDFEYGLQRVLDGLQSRLEARS